MPASAHNNTWIFRYFTTLFVTIIFMTDKSSSASAPVTWGRSTFFSSGQFVVTPTSGSSFNVPVTYTFPLTGAPNKKPSIGFTDANYQFTLPIVYMKIDLPGYTQTGLTASATINYAAVSSIKLSYLAPDPSMTYFFNSLTWSLIYSYTGPFLNPLVLPITGAPPGGLDLTHELSMLVFLNGFNLSSSSYCFELNLRGKIFSSTNYQLNISSNCNGMTNNFVAYSRIFFDITAIENFGYCFFQYGTYTGVNNDPSTLNIQLTKFVVGNFLLGVNQFRYTSPTGPIIMSYNTSLTDLITTTTNTVFERLVFTYWSLRYRQCPAGYPLFHLPTETCYDLCPDGTYYSSSTQVCKDCFYTCKTCTGEPACNSCQATNNRYLNGTSCLPNAGFYDNGTAIAPPCSPHCIDCTNSSICLACDSGYTINASSQCQSICMQGCTICPNMSECTVCDTANGYYLSGSICLYCNSSLDQFINMSSLQCQPCGLMGCTDCISLTACNACNTSNNYAMEGLICDYCNNTLNQFINTTFLCQNCSQPGCITCLSLTTCYLCNNTQDYYLMNSTCHYCNSTNNYFINSFGQCQLCILNQCVLCASLVQCSACNLTANYYLLNQTCEYCNNSQNNFINITTSQCEACSIPGCIICSSLASCLVCDTNNNFYALGLICGYCNNTINDFINSSSLCQQCTISGCVTCISLTTCSACNISGFYYLVSPICQYCNITLNYYISMSLTCQYCNNSLNNFINSTNQCEACSIPGCIICSSLTSCSICDTNNNFYVLGLICGYCNNTLNDFINPNTQLCQSCILTDCVTCQNLQICHTCNTTGGFFLNSLSLCQLCQQQGCLQCQSLTSCKICDSALGYSLNSIGTCDLCSNCKCYIQKELPPSIPSIGYSQKQCQTFEGIDSALFVVFIAVFSIMILATFTTCLIGIELIGVLQLAFLNMGDNLFVHLYLGPILGWYYVNGYNIKPVEFQGVPSNIQQIGYTSGFLNNVNVMFGVLILSTALFVIVQVIDRNLTIKILKIRTIIRQIFIATYLFNALNISFSLGLQYEYFRSEYLGFNLYSLSVLCACLIIPLYLALPIWLTFAKKLNCGEYTQRFKTDCVNQLYIPITILYRFALGAYMSTENQDDMSTLLILAISLAFIMFNLINLSYKKAYHNYRANISHISQIIILMVTNYYRSMKKNYPIEVKATINTPAIIEIVSIFICVLAGLLGVVYQIFLKFKNLNKKHKKDLKITPTQGGLQQNNSKLRQQNHNDFNLERSNHKFTIQTQIVE